MKKVISEIIVGLIITISGLGCGSGGGGQDPPPAPTGHIVVTDPVAPFDDLLLSFGSITATMMQDQIVTVTNSGTGNLVVGTVGSINPLSSPFSITTDSCSNHTIVSAGSCTLAIRFAPAVAGGFTDSFDIPSNDPVHSTITMNLNGTGVAVPGPHITVTDSVVPVNDLLISFGGVTANTTVNQTVTVTNSGDSDLIMGTIASANSVTVPFSIIADNCSNQTIVSAGSCTLNVRFAPGTTTGVFADSFDIPSNDPAQATVTVLLSGSAGDPRISLSIGAINYGNVSVGSSLSQAITISNTGYSNLSVAISITGADATMFSVSVGVGGACASMTPTIAALSNCTFSFTFSPSSTGAKFVSLTIASNDPLSPINSIASTGNGI